MMTVETPASLGQGGVEGTRKLKWLTGEDGRTVLTAVEEATEATDPTNGGDGDSTNRPRREAEGGVDGGSAVTPLLIAWM